jgi:hypothetical protein
MAIHYSFFREEGLLRVKATGRDENLDAVIEYGMAVIPQALEIQATHSLCDETELEYNLSTISTFVAGKFIAEHAPRVAKVAIVCNIRCLPDARFWEDVTHNRGLQTGVFTDIGEAKDWLNES